MKRPIATKYSTWLQVAVGSKPAALVQVIEIWYKAGEVEQYTLLKLDGSLETANVAPDVLERMIKAEQLVPCVPAIPQKIIPPAS